MWDGLAYYIAVMNSKQNAHGTIHDPETMPASRIPERPLHDLLYNHALPGRAGLSPF